MEISVDTILDTELDTLNGYIAEAQKQGDLLKLQVCQDLSIAVQTAFNVYTVEKTDQAAHATLSELSELVAAASTEDRATLLSAAARVHALSKTFPFDRAQTQIESISPKFFVPTDNGVSVTIGVKSNSGSSLLELFRKSTAPQLTIRSQTFSCTEIKSDELKFKVPSSLITLDPTRVTVVEGELSLPWNTTWVNLFQPHAPDTYKILMTSLPASPGTVTFEYTTFQSITETQKNTQGPFSLEARFKDQVNTQFTAKPKDGWLVVKDSSQIVNVTKTATPGSTEGPTLVKDSASGVTYSASAFRSSQGVPARIEFSITFMEQRSKVVESKKVETLSLSWGDSLSIDQPNHPWKITYRDFNGEVKEFTSLDTSNPYLKIENVDGMMVIRFMNPAVINSID